MKTLTDVIAFMRACMETHEVPATQLEVGSQDFHDDCVREYAEAIAVLEELRDIAT